VKTVKRSYIVAFLFLVAFNSSTAQNEKCISKVINYIDEMAAITQPKNGVVYHMKHSITTKFHKDQNIPDASTTSETILTYQKRIVEDVNMKVYADSKNVFVIIPRSKLIYWNNSDPIVFEPNKSQVRFLTLEKELLKTSTVTCSEKEGKIVISLVPDKKVTNQIFLIRQQIVFNKSLNRIEKVSNYFNRKGKVREQVTTYLRLDYNSNKHIKNNVINYVFSAGKLNPAFRGYKLIDNRTK